MASDPSRFIYDFVYVKLLSSFEKTTLINDRLLFAKQQY